MTSCLHPYGAMPLGNALFASKTLLQVRSNGLGVLKILTDESMLETLVFLNGIDLARFSQTSHICYVFAMTSDLWRDLTLRLVNVNIRFNRTWRDTYVEHYVKSQSREFNPVYIHSPIIVQGVYSDLLHRLWACHSFDIEALCQGFYTNNDIAEVDASSLDVDTFIRDYEAHNIPLVIKGGARHWPALTKWTADYLTDVCSSAEFRATSATAPEAVSFTMDEYFDYSRQIREEVPLYLFERQFLKNVPQLANDFSIPVYFDSSTTPGTDLFRVLGDTARPDYRWLVAGPKRSGSIFHIDPNQTNAWNVSITGRKKWIFYPPHVCPPGVVASDDGGDVTVPLSTGEWLLTFWTYHLEARRDPDLSRRPVEVIAYPGDVVFVPHNWWHMVINLDECIAITQNYVSTSNLSDCLRFLREKTDQISGVRDRPGEAVTAETIYDEFVGKLTLALPNETIQHAINESYILPPVIKRKGRNNNCNILSSNKRNRRDKTRHNIIHINNSTDENDINSDTDKTKNTNNNTFSFSFSM